MNPTLSDNIWNILTCSYCGQKLEKTNAGAVCPVCGSNYGYSKSGSLDLRLTQSKKYPADFELGTPLLPASGFQFDPLQSNSSPQVDFSGMEIPRHLSKQILSYFPKAKSQESMMLDLGCGKAVHKDAAEHAGFEWVGLDYEALEAPIFGDAQALPFKDNSFEFILCVSVIQYVRFPFVMIREAQRVLKPGGRLIGTVAFLEPSHGTSFYHFTHLGTYNLLQHGGLTVEKIAPSETWSSLKAQAGMGMFYGMPRSVARAMVYPLELLHKLWWRVAGLVKRQPLENLRIRHFTGSFAFIASKP
ncbi:MAG TPA: methyltransferase domain-containing protein [Anaerolineales bacterium]